MFYRLIIIVFGIVLVAILFGLLWFISREFLKRHGVRGDLSEATTLMATWTFAGVAVGLVFMGFGALLAGPWCFYLAARKNQLAVSDAGAIGWGFFIVLGSLLITGGGLALLLYVVGAF